MPLARPYSGQGVVHELVEHSVRGAGYHEIRIRPAPSAPQPALGEVEHEVGVRGGGRVAAPATAPRAHCPSSVRTLYTLV